MLFRSPGTCLELDRTERESRIAAGANYALRLNTRAAAKGRDTLTFVERGSGPAGENGVIAVDPHRLGDVVLARKDTPTSYHLAVVVDDAHQGVTLVTRGNDLFAATHVQRLLQDILGLAEPAYAHHRLILDESGRKFSKRDSSVTLSLLRESGVTASEIRKRIGFD